MVGRYWYIISIVILISFVGGYSAFEPQNKYVHESKLIIRSLEEALAYLRSRRESVTGDVILGVLIARANLQWVYNTLKDYFNDSSWVDGHVDKMLNQCRQLLDANKFKNYALLREDLWEDAAGNLKHGFLGEHDERFLLPDFDSCESIDAFLMRGTPENSDLCINELLTSKCQVSEHCWLSEVNGDSHSGYKTSHRLLYFQLATKSNCEEVNPVKFRSAGVIKSKLCQQMLLEAVALFEKPTLSVMRDLFMEQIALCGLEGHEEFAREDWRDQVRNWQNYNGCFGQGAHFENCTVDAHHKNYYKRIKKTDSVIDGCHTHITAVAISALAFFLRVTLKLVFLGQGDIQ